MPKDRSYEFVSTVRRFSHLLTGGAGDGDSLVRAALTSFSGSGHLLSRVDVYARVVEIWNESRAAGCEEQDTDVYPGAGVDNAVQRLSPNAKLAFLLVYVEEFPLREAARILQISIGELETHVSDALLELAGVKVDTLNN